MGVAGNKTGGGSKPVRRNSSIELLRILSMLMIVLSHFVVHNEFDYTTMPFGAPRFLVQLFLESGGKIGVVIFFTISAWFFLDREQTVRGCIRRIWALEKELLFYSLALALLFFLFDRPDIGPKLMVHSMLPLVFSVWWYPTAYALFLCFLPFLEKGLRGMGRSSHLSLCLILLVLYAGISLIPGTQMVGQVYSFVYLFVLISAYRWYLEGEWSPSPAKMMLAGMAILAAYVVWSMVAWQFGGYQLGAKYGNFVTDAVRLPCILVGFGLFILFERREFHSQLIDFMAAGAFAVYLITDYGASQVALWRGPLDLGLAVSSPCGFALAMLSILGVYLACTLVDAVRRAAFKRCVDPWWGRLFDRLATWVDSELTRFGLAALLDRPQAHTERKS